MARIILEKQLMLLFTLPYNQWFENRSLKLKVFKGTVSCVGKESLHYYNNFDSIATYPGV